MMLDIPGSSLGDSSSSDGMSGVILAEIGRNRLPDGISAGFGGGVGAGSDSDEERNRR